MKESYLVQRLKKPYGSAFGGDNPFSFGGGLRNGGLSEETMDLLRNIFSFDYMGAAEFEFGAVPEALRKIVNNINDYITMSFTLPYSQVKPSWRDKSEKAPEGEATIYVICKKDDVGEVRVRIQHFAAGTEGIRLKELTLLSNVLRPSAEWDIGESLGGWFELDNGFFFFTDKVMWEKTATLFGLEI